MKYLFLTLLILVLAGCTIPPCSNGTEWREVEHLETLTDRKTKTVLYKRLRFVNQCRPIIPE